MLRFRGSDIICTQLLALWAKTKWKARSGYGARIANRIWAKWKETKIGNDMKMSMFTGKSLDELNLAKGTSLRLVSS
jgi:hypothetical protein